MPGIARQNPIMQPRSKAPNAWPPTFVAVTNRRTGISSTSSNPQMSCCKRTASTNSLCVRSARISIMSFRILPELFHFAEGRIARGFAARPQAALDVREAAAEFRVGFAQRLLGVHFKKPRDVDEDEQQIADLAFDRLGGGGVAQLFHFLLELAENLLDVFPIEPRARGARRDLPGFHQRRQRARDSFEQSGFARLFFRLDLIPAALDVAGGFRLAGREDVRMTANQLLVDGAQ